MVRSRARSRMLGRLQEFRIFGQFQIECGERLYRRTGDQHIGLRCFRPEVEMERADGAHATASERRNERVGNVGVREPRLRPGIQRVAADLVELRRARSGRLRVGGAGDGESGTGKAGGEKFAALHGSSGGATSHGWKNAARKTVLKAHRFNTTWKTLLAKNRDRHDQQLMD